MKVGWIYRLAEYQMFGGPIDFKHCLIIEEPTSNDSGSFIPLFSGETSKQNACFYFDKIDSSPEEFALIGKSWPLSLVVLDQLVSKLSDFTMERLMRAIVRCAVGRYHQYGHKSKEFIPHQSPVPVSGRVFGVEDVQSLVDASLDFWLTTGRFNDEFERQFASFLGARYVLTTNSGSSANLLALAALTSPKLGDKTLNPGDEVITVAAGFPTTVNPILQYNLIPVFVDVDIPTYNIDASQIENAVSSKSRAIMIAHTLGNSFDLEEVIRVAKKYDLWVIEDCCDALGTTFTPSSDLTDYKGHRFERNKPRFVGTFGDIATFSFYPAHHITMGEGGAVLTNNGKLKSIIASFRDWGRDCFCKTGEDNTCKKRFCQKIGLLPEGYDHKYTYSHVGYNMKITDMQAAVGLSQLQRLESFIQKRKDNFNYLSQVFLEMSDVFILPKATPHCNPSWFGFPLTVRKKERIDREELLRFLENMKIGTRLLFGGNITKQPYMQGKSYRIIGELSNTDNIMKNTFWLGLYPALNFEMLDFVANALRKFVEQSVSKERRT